MTRSPTGRDRPESTLSNNDSLLQEFREFEAQIYSGIGVPEQDIRQEIAQSSSLSISNPDGLPIQENRTFDPEHQAPYDESPDELEPVNPHPVLPFAQEDPIETHDLVVAKMAADGAVWVPSQSTPPVQHPNRRSNPPDSLRWYSAEIEEDRLHSPTNVSNPSWLGLNTSQQRLPQTDRIQQFGMSTTNPLGSFERISPSSSIAPPNRSHPNHANQQQSATSRIPTTSSPCTDFESIKTLNSNHEPKQPCTSNHPALYAQQAQTDSTRAELEARLNQEVARRKQQDDYIRQLQTYYDNLLAKHALAEVTIDQLRMGAQVRTDSEERRSVGFDSSGSRPSFGGGLRRSMQYLSQPVGPQTPSRSGSVFLSNIGQLRPNFGETPTSRYASTPYLRLPSPSIENKHLPPPPYPAPSSIQQNNQSRLSEVDVNRIRSSLENAEQSRYDLTNSVNGGTLRRRPSVEMPHDRQQTQSSTGERSHPGPLPSDKLQDTRPSRIGSSQYLARQTVSVPNPSLQQSVTVVDGQRQSSPDSMLPVNPETSSSPRDTGQYSDSIRMHLLFSIGKLQASLTGHQRRFVETGEAPTRAQLDSYREDYSLLKKCFQAAKQHWRDSFC
ncbi:Rac guanyl-nucleotide exchange factor, partial [Clonorchis sinensis]